MILTSRVSSDRSNPRQRRGQRRSNACLPMIVGVGRDDLPWSLSADNNSCTPLASLPSADSVSCARRAVDHTYVSMIAFNKRFLISAMQFWSCAQQKPAYMRVAPTDTLLELLRLACLSGRALANRRGKRPDEIPRGPRQDVLQRLFLASRLGRLLRG